MKKIILSLTLALGLVFGSAPGAAEPALAQKKLEPGFVQIYDLGPLTLHAYQTADPMADECFLLETAQNLVALESPSFQRNIEEWQNYVQSLNKPLTDILIACHPAGGRWFGQAESWATEGAKAAITEGPTRALTESLGQVFGPDFLTEIPPLDKTLTEGLNRVGGIDFEIIENGDGYDVAIPSAQVIYTHMLGADTHSIVAGPEHLKAVLASLESMKAGGYRLILSSHHTPETPADLETKIAYIKRIEVLAGQNQGREKFIEAVKKEFPGYQGLNYLDMTAGHFFGE